MILDGAPQHRAADVKKALKEMNGEVELEFLPPGCPDLSAIEELWRQMKHAVLDTAYVKLSKMCRDINDWIKIVHAETGCGKIPLQGAVGLGPAHRTWIRTGDRAHINSTLSDGCSLTPLRICMCGVFP